MNGMNLLASSSDKKNQSACNNTIGNNKDDPKSPKPVPIQTETIILNNNDSTILKLDINVNNVVCSYSTKCHLNLRRIALEGMHVEYKKENGMLNMKLRKPYTTATIWSSGKITCAGAKSESDAYKAARRYCRLLQKMQFKVKMSNYRVVNVLATCTLPFNIDIIKLSNQFKKECSYEPELHPGATFKLKEFKSTLKLFTTGSITLTSPSVELIHKSINHIYPILYEYRHVPSSDLNNIKNDKNNNNNNNNNSDCQQVSKNNTITSDSFNQFNNNHNNSLINDLRNLNNNNNNSNILVKTCSNSSNFSNSNNNIINNNNNINNQFYNETNNPFSYSFHHHPIYSTDSLSNNSLNTNNSNNNGINGSYAHGTSVITSLPFATHSVATSSLSNTSHHWFNYDNLLIDNVNVDDFLP